MTLSAQDLAELQTELIGIWNAPVGPAPQALAGVAVAQTLTGTSGARPGFAIGQGVGVNNDLPRLELRVSAEAPEQDQQDARRIAETARARGADVRLRELPVPIVEMMQPPATMGPVAQAQNVGGGGTAGGSFAARCRPLHIGCSIGHEQGSAGSLAAFVTLPDGKVGALSCCHVLALCGAATTGDPILQPGRPDQEPVLGSDRIAELTGFFTLFARDSPLNLDAAVALVNNGVGPVSNVLPDSPHLPTGFRSAALGGLLPATDLTVGSVVGRVGRTSGLAIGRVTAVNMDNYTVRYGQPRSGDYIFHNLVEIEWSPRALPGDSGSLIFRLPDFRPVALHFAGLPDPYDPLGYAFTLERILTAFNLSLV